VLFGESFRATKINARTAVRSDPEYVDFELHSWSKIRVEGFGETGTGLPFVLGRLGTRPPNSLSWSMEDFQDFRSAYQWTLSYQSKVSEGQKT